MPGEAAAANSGAGFGALCLLLLSWLALGRVWFSGVKKAPGIVVCPGWLQWARFNKGSFVFPEMCSGKRNHLKFAKYEVSCNFVLIHYFCVFPVPFFRIFIQG